MDEEQIGNLCDVGGCDEEGVYDFEGWNVCTDHFALYLEDKFDLAYYFYLKLRKITGDTTKATTLAEEDLFNFIDFMAENENEELGDEYCR